MVRAPQVHLLNSRSSYVHKTGGRKNVLKGAAERILGSRECRDGGVFPKER